MAVSSTIWEAFSLPSVRWLLCAPTRIFIYSRLLFSLSAILNLWYSPLWRLLCLFHTVNKDVLYRRYFGRKMSQNTPNRTRSFKNISRIISPNVFVSLLLIRFNLSSILITLIILLSIIILLRLHRCPHSTIYRWGPSLSACRCLFWDSLPHYVTSATWMLVCTVFRSRLKIHLFTIMCPQSRTMYSARRGVAKIFKSTNTKNVQKQRNFFAIF